jgi:phosphoribosylformimino-5-aminoimidazole carboxamide ribotide isomerase
MTLFRPCIDLHHGKVKQIVGGSLRDEGSAASTARENFVSELPASYYAKLYRRDQLTGAHVIQLGAGNETAALDALRAWPKGLQLGGGVTPDNARHWLDAGASKVIVTSALFEGAELSEARLDAFARVVSPEELVIDLSCRKRGSHYWVTTNRWQTVTETPLNGETLRRLSRYCSEFLVHAADVEGLCQGIEGDVVRLLGAESPLPCTYAGGGRQLEDLELVAELSGGRVDLTFGSALDLFGGSGVRYADCVAYNRRVG